MGQTSNPKIKRALVSVSNKEGITKFCSDLQEKHQVEIVSTGGTLRTLLDSGAVSYTHLTLPTILLV